MFDTEKIQRMTTELEKIPNEFDNVYVIPEIFTADAAALFKRLNIRVRAVIQDSWTSKEVWGIPIIKTTEAEFNKRTVLILLTTKPMPFIQTNFDVKTTGGGIINIPAVVMAPDEVMAVYDRLILLKYIGMYVEDGLKSVQSAGLPERFARGLTAISNPHSQSVKIDTLDIKFHFKPTYDFDDTGIVIQGPLVYDNNYTVETFKLYREIYPNIPIVVSTWQGEATNAFRKACKENSIVLLENEPPEDRGACNVNLQLKSSFQGVKYICENTNAKYVLKTRTDQCIYRFDFLAHFKNLLETFPPKDEKLHKRIIFLCTNDLNQFPFYYQDYLAFGHVEDISKLYSIPFHHDPGEMTYTASHNSRMQKLKKILTVSHSFDYNSSFAKNLNQCKVKRWASKFCFPEMYISKTFYKQYIAPIDKNKLAETSWKFAAEYLILIDPEAILCDWSKYEYKRYKATVNIGGQSAFSRWLDMYRNFKID